MGGKVFICTLVCGLSVGATYAQQVDIPREKAGKVQQPKRVAAQPIVEIRPQTFAFNEAPKLSIEQMRQAGALAAQKVKEENHDIEADSSGSDLPPPPPKKQVTTNAVRPLDRPVSSETAAGKLDNKKSFIG